jgi:outer membrane immunogenic protein
MKKLLLTTVSALAFSVPAMAADVVEPAPFDWTGPYVGVNVGATIFDDNLDLSGGLIPGQLSGGDGSETDVTFGAQVGYNFQTDNLLLGIEGDFNYLNADDDLLLTGKGGAKWESDHDWFATIRARAGLVSDQTLFYITGGVAFLDSSYELTDLAFGASEGDDDTLVGWTNGGGVEYAFSEDWSAKIEYLYADFGSVDEKVSGGLGTFKGSADPELHVIRAGLNYHF